MERISPSPARKTKGPNVAVESHAEGSLAPSKCRVSAWPPGSWINLHVCVPEERHASWLVIISCLGEAFFFFGGGGMRGPRFLRPEIFGQEVIFVIHTPKVFDDPHSGRRAMSCIHSPVSDFMRLQHQVTGCGTSTGDEHQGLRLINYLPT